MDQANGIKVETVIANDDVASAAKAEREKRRRREGCDPTMIGAKPCTNGGSGIY
jgi:dihydroxyacetone kinase